MKAREGQGRRVTPKTETIRGVDMVSALDVAAFILREKGPMTAMKLQKLVYYSQAWSLVWDEEPLFFEAIQAWANGPVVPELFQAHKGRFKVDHIPDGDATKLNAKQAETVWGVLGYYGDKSSQWLSDLTHMEDPWKSARNGCPDGASCNAVIGLDSMAEYYGSLSPDDV